MEFPDDEDDELMLSAMQTYETGLDQLDESVRFVGTQELTNNNNVPDAKYLIALKENFGHNSFRPLQWQIIHAILLEKRDCCAVFTTGYGKSLCYMYPSVFTSGVTLVISPLISLMQDQVMALSVLNIMACFLGSAQKESLYNDIVLGLYRVVYVTPEYVTADVGRSLVEDLGESLTLVAIDEAHCVSSWGHDFRYAFRSLSCIRDLVPKVPIMALTATATKSVLTDIIHVLKLNDPLKLCSGFDRPNLKLIVKPKVSPWTDLSRYIRAHSEGSIIIYCLKRKETDKIVKLLCDQGIDCGAYHAGLSLKVRKDTHERFVRDQLRIIVATVAFGMGIDKPDVRCVINYGASRDVESYYQEIGRAGRDGQRSNVITFYNRSDLEFHEYMRSTAKNAAHRAHMETLNMKFQEYLEGTGCRRKFLMKYFGDPVADSLCIRSNCCDNCDLMMANPDSKIEYLEVDEDGLCDFSVDARILMTSLQVLGPYYGIGMTILFLRGANSRRIPDRHLSHPMRGSGSGKTEQWWKLLYELLERHGFIKTTSTRLPGKGFFAKRISVALTEDARRWLNGTSKLQLKPSREMFPYFNVKRKAVDAQSSRTYNLADSKADVKAKLHLRIEEDSPDLSMDKEKSFDEEFRKRLFSFRMQLAVEVDVMPYMVVSEKCLYQMVEQPPLESSQLSSYDGLSLAKISMFGSKFIGFIKRTLEELKAEYPEECASIGQRRLKTDALEENTRISTQPSTSAIVKVEVKEEPEEENVHSILTQPSSSEAPKVEIKPDPDQVDLNSSLFDDSDDESLLLLEQAVLKHESESPPVYEPPAKKKLMEIKTATATGPLKYDNDSDSSDGDDVIASVPSTQQRVLPGWLSARNGGSTTGTGPSQSSVNSNNNNKRSRSIKNVW